MGHRVIVLGSINVDLLASVRRLPSPGETVAGDGFVRQLGGKGANQAVAAARAGASTMLLAATGNDAEGFEMTESLAHHGVDVGSVARTSAPTGHALVVTSPGDNQIVVIAGANGLVDRALAASVEIGAGDVCVSQMETPTEAAAEFFARAHDAGAMTLLNAAPASDAVRALLPAVDILIVNETELELLSGVCVEGGGNDDALARAIARPGLCGVPVVIVTLGALGAVIARGGALKRIAGRRAAVVDTTGAGDCFCGYLAAGLARGEDLEAAVVEANIAASIAVQSLGAASSIPSRTEIMPALAVAQASGS